MTTRGVKNNNPGNIRKTEVSWEGEAAVQADPAFEVFTHSWWGLRALAVLLRNYQRKHGLNTVNEIINRWAPPSDNNPTTAYIDFVTNHLGTTRSQRLNLEAYGEVRGLVEAIILFENGSNPYSWEITTGLILAGIEPGETIG